MAHSPLWVPVDPLGEALHLLRLRGTFYCRSELTAPWGLTMPPMEGCLWFHVVTAGRCALEGDGIASLPLLPGDFALVPHGRGHILRTSVDAPTPDVTELPQQLLSERYSLLAYGRGGARTTLVCGVVRFDHPFAYELADLLPPVIHLDASSVASAEWMQSTLRLMAAEAKQLQPGGETVITRLADVLVIQAIRAWLREAPAGQGGWLGALRDERLGQALMQVHRDPARAWTVGSLAAEAGMSRSAFAARFTELVGEPPMQCVARLRIRIAETMLREHGTSIGELASQLGYRSEAAFRRTFKRFAGRPPGAVRRGLHPVGGFLEEAARRQQAATARLSSDSER